MNKLDLQMCSQNRTYSYVGDLLTEIIENCVCVCEVAQSCPTLWDSMDCSTPGFPVHHHLPELAQTPFHRSRWCQPTITFSVVPFSSSLQSFPASRSFPVSQFFASCGRGIGAPASNYVFSLVAQLCPTLCDPMKRLELDMEQQTGSKLCVIVTKYRTN